MKHWHILGVGNHGSFLAHYLRKNSNKVTLLIRDPTTLSKFSKLQNMIEVTKEFEPEVDISKDFKAECLHGYDYRNVIDSRHPNEPCPPHLRIKRLIVTLKSHEFSKYYQRIFHRLTPKSTILLFNYGLGSYEELMSDYYTFDEACRPNILICLNSHHVYKKATFGSQFKLIHSGFGEIDLGVVPRRFDETEEKKLDTNLESEKSLEVEEDDDNEDLEEVSSLTDGDDDRSGDGGGGDDDDDDDMEEDTLNSVIRTFRKIPELNARNIRYLGLVSRKLENLAVNAVIDPFTSIYYVRNGALLYNRTVENIIKPICAETSMVIRKHREHLGMRPSNRFATDRLINAVFQVCLKTRNNESPMLQDVKKNHPTEINYLNGYIVKLGQIYNIPTPINHFLINMVKARHNLQTDPKKLNYIFSRKNLS